MNLPRKFSSDSANIHLAPHSFIYARRSDLTDVLIFPSVQQTCEFTEILAAFEIKVHENGLIILEARLIKIKSYSVQ